MRQNHYILYLAINEPYKFAQANKTWENIQKMQPQFILRYGATFLEKENIKTEIKEEVGDKVKV